MRSFLFCLLLGISFTAAAAVVSEKDVMTGAVPRKSIETKFTNRANHKILLDKKLAEDRPMYDGFLESEEAVRLGQISDLTTKENIKAVDNFVRLADKNPENLMQRLIGAKPGQVEWPTRGTTRLGSQEEVRGSTAAKDSDNPLEMLTSIRMHDVTGSYDDMERDSQYVKQVYEKKAIPVLKNLSHEFLGQKAAPVILSETPIGATSIAP